MVINNSLLVTLVVSLLTVVSSNNSSSATTGTSSATTATSTASSQTTTPNTGTTPIPPTLSPKEECPKHNKSCDDCIKAANYKCFYCYDGDKCMEYPVGSVLPVKECNLAKARWGVCWVNFEALIIAMSVIGGIIILTITCCCIRCFCCRGGDKKKYMKEEAKWERQKADRKQRSDDRRADRKERMDEIRRKYGLVKEDTPYQRFDA